MTTLILQRVSETPHATFGVLIQAYNPFAVTLELPWQDNQPDISCVPPAAYVCKRIVSPRFGETFEITNVTGRTHILFHWGNWTRDTLGCVIVGEKFAVLKGEAAVAESKNLPNEGFNEFMNRLAGVDTFQLIIRKAH